MRQFLKIAWCSLLFSCPLMGAGKKASVNHCESFFQSPGFGSTYFVFTRRFGLGTFAEIESNLENIKALGRRKVLISPVHEQTVDHHNGTDNDHMYWPSDPSSIAAILGGESAFRSLITKAKNLGVDIVLDVVPDHGGYADSMTMRYERDGHLVEKVIHSDDPNYFRQEKMSADFFDQERHLHGDEEQLMAYQERLAELRWMDLLVYNHQNPEILEWLLYSYKKFADMGIRHFRIDAAKHMPKAFVSSFVRRLHTYIKERYDEPSYYILEHLWPSYTYLHPFVRNIIDELKDIPVYFFDFPHGNTIRHFVTAHNEGFENFVKYLDWRWETILPYMRRYLPIMEDHDLGARFQSKFASKAAYALADFTSFHPTVLFNGGEEGGTHRGKRDHVHGVNPHGLTGTITDELNKLLQYYRAGNDFHDHHVHFAEGPRLLIEKRRDDQSIFLYIDRSHGPHKFEWALGHEYRLDPAHHTMFSLQQIRWQFDGGKVMIDCPDQSIVFFTLKRTGPY